MQRSDSDRNDTSPEGSERLIAALGRSDGGRLISATSRTASISETNMARHSWETSDDRNAPPNPAHLYTKIKTFFANTRRASRTSHKDGMVDLQAACPGPFPNFPQPIVPGDTEPPCHDLLTEDQEKYFLRLFWEAFHPLLQSSDEKEFHSLLDLDRRQACEASGLTRALADGMMALGIQYGHAAGLTSRILSLRRCDTNMPAIGWAYHRRCRNFIAQLAEPSLHSLQCYALASLYLMNANRYREAYGLLGAAIRLSHSVNLHQEPSEQLRPRERVSLKQIWWLLFTLDLKCSQQLGIPLGVQAAAVTCPLPSVEELKTKVGTTNNCWNNVSASTYFVQAAKLASTLAEINRLVPTSKLYESVVSRAEVEQRAILLATAMTSLEHWRQGLPDDLLNSRKTTGHAEAMSTVESPLVLELGAPNWLHVQRVLLEVNYHNACVMLQRPFICFSQASESSRVPDSQTEGHTRSALQHAVALVVIVHSLCATSDIFSGRPAILHPLWNATVTIIGYILANPLASRSRKAIPWISKALAVFEGFAATEPFAAQAEERAKLLMTNLHGMLADLDDHMPNRNRDRLPLGLAMRQSPDTDFTTPSDHLSDIRIDSIVGGDLEGLFEDPMFSHGSLCASGGPEEVNTWAAYQGQLEMWNNGIEHSLGVMHTM